MSDKLKQLLEKKVIPLSVYDTYVLFELNELGRKYLANAIDSLSLEQPEESTLNDPYAWHDGRKSIWRDIKIIILKVKIELETLEDDRDSKPRSGKRNYDTVGVFTDRI